MRYSATQGLARGRATRPGNFRRDISKPGFSGPEFRAGFEMKENIVYIRVFSTEPKAQPGTRPEARIFKLSTRKPARNPENRVGLARQNPALCRALVPALISRLLRFAYWGNYGTPQKVNKNIRQNALNVSF